MEDLELQRKIINLGKLFVKELKLETSVDTLSRWMAHYIAEKIIVAEESDGIEKQDAEKECFEAILELWKHRNSLPHERRPFMKFENILETLTKLDPEREKSYFFNLMRNAEMVEVTNENFDHNSVEECLNMIKEIDQTAKIWIEYLLQNAAKNVVDEKVIEWLENAVHLPDNTDAVIIHTILDKNPKFYDDEHNEEFLKNYEIQRLQKRITELKRFEGLNSFLLAQYEDDLQKIL
ncbi:hypothetical protein [Chryseobacterium sp. 18068]|uniref:hypothetical protein n=1 Tax=Chryseobacterium sp. 18068 TaxID=2681414 RepID=UPI0013587591|nr:hypothetical protein [Chryseobacterium sp. 18068]